MTCIVAYSASHCVLHIVLCIGFNIISYGACCQGAHPWQPTRVPNRSCLTTESKFVRGLKSKNYHPATIAHIKNAGALDLYFIGL